MFSAFLMNSLVVHDNGNACVQILMDLLVFYALSKLEQEVMLRYRRLLSHTSGNATNVMLSHGREVETFNASNQK